MMSFNYESFPLPAAKEPHPEGVFCEGCGHLIEIGETAIEVFIGDIGRGEKSGRLMVTDHKSDPYEPVTVHIWCAHNWITENIWEGPAPNESPQLCDGCGIKLDDKILGDDD